MKELNAVVKEFTAKEIAFEIGRHVNYVYAMRGKGFTGRTVAEAKEWIRATGFVFQDGYPVLTEKNEQG